MKPPGRFGKMFEPVYSGKRVLITGHTGFKGAWLAEWLLRIGAKVTGFALPASTKPSLFELQKLSSRMASVEGDIRDFSAIQRIVKESKPEIIFHLAAQAIVKDSYDDPKGTFNTNILGTVNLFESLRLHSGTQALVIVTSDKCYENDGKKTNFKETDPLGGHDPYSASKACAEIVSHSYIRSFFKNEGVLGITTCRAGNVIGGGDWASHRIVPDCMRAWSKKEVATIRNPESTRPWQHVLESLSGYLTLGARLLNDPQYVHGESFNFGPAPGETYSVKTLVAELQKHWPDTPWKISEDASRRHPEAIRLQLNCEKAKRILGWYPTLGFDQAVSLTSQWFRNFYENGDVVRLTQEQIASFEKSFFEAKY
jgi:CDP-glucose 4,6-dehydratase